MRVKGRRASADSSRSGPARPRRENLELLDRPALGGPGSGGSSVRWSAAAVFGRQFSQIACALVLARILGPETYGIISAATVYVTFTTLLLDQGLSAALVQRPVLNRRTPGAVATANVLSGILLAAATWFAAPAVADFFRAPALTDLLRILGLGLLIKAAAITPRAMNLRLLRFKVIGAADIAGGVLGAALGIAAGLLGAGIWSMAVQVLVTDATIALLLLVRTRGFAPNVHLRELSAILPFSLRIFASNGLAFLSRSMDNVLVGRFLGVGSLSLYAMAYRVLVIPVQMIGQTVNRVTFPTFSRLADDQPRLAANVKKVTELLAFATIPLMVLIAVAAPELIQLVLGSAWAATAPVLAVLSIAGARETVFSVTQSLMRAKGEGKLIFRYEIVAAITQLAGIVIGLRFGLMGVAIGLTTAGFLLSPILLVIQRRLAGVSIRTQLRIIVVPLHSSVWAAGAYLLIRLVGWGVVPTLLVGLLGYVFVSAIVLWTVHRRAVRRALAGMREILLPRRAGGEARK